MESLYVDFMLKKVGFTENEIIELYEKEKIQTNNGNNFNLEEPIIFYTKLRDRGGYTSNSIQIRK